MYEVFFKESVFRFNSDKPCGLQHVYSTDSALAAFITERLDDESPWQANICGFDNEFLFERFKLNFKVVGAAGGAVCNADSVLAIQRLGCLDLPKGHIEAGESVEACAVREVEEECGTKQLHIIRPLSDTWHIYFRDNRWHLKRTYWFVMTAPAHQSLAPQTEEDIESVFWLKRADVLTRLPETYASLRPIFEEVALI